MYECLPKEQTLLVPLALASELKVYYDVASFGALTTVLSLAFDPFMQQVVFYKLRSVHRADASIGRTQVYGNAGLADSDTISLQQRAAFYNGIFNGDAVTEFVPVCSTGNCTWTPISSLAIWSACENVDVKTAVSCNTSETVEPYNYGLIIKNCSFKPSNSSAGFQVWYQITDGGEDSYSVFSVTLTNSIAWSSYEPQNITIAGLPNPWVAFARAMLTNSRANALDVTNVTICALTPCLKTYNVSVYKGSPVSKVLNTWHFPSWTYDILAGFGFAQPLMDVIKGTANRTFKIELQSGMGFIDLLQEAFNGSAFSGAPPGLASYTSDTMQALYQTDDLGHLMDTVAASLSSHIRTVSSEVALGKVWAMETYVHVR